MTTMLSAVGCLEFARELDAHPRQLSDSAQRHVERCALCRSRLQAQLQWEQDLERSLRSDLPDALDDRILLRHRLRRAPPQRRFVLAAVLLLALTGWAAGSAAYQRMQLNSMLDDLTVHAQQESMLFAERAAVDELQLRAWLAAAAIALPADVDIRLVKPCRSLGVAGIDIVIETGAGVAVLTLLPDRRLRSSAQRATASEHGDELHVALLPAPRGALALTAHNAAALQLARAMVVVGRRSTPA